ncbi:N-formylglutamate deformylase [Azospirillum formosense]|uniref:N-formylglutamate deformylase n=1 Tax=Azospirillum formosense TaxID=861533 RepID=A0ABX2KZW4_9PROT|nr:N-formylglutamate deformylase [Azospirillum formosense]MBY3752951.1 N-formylglutamate deformylase [Azospirillum formosense]NUB22196.1 N-formylglutamate deformylase [Azospirillum formosense]
METFRFQPGETPVLLSIPHVGTIVPPDIATTMTDAALAVPDTDWHLDRLYHFAPALGIGFLRPIASRYVIDLNRDPDGAAPHPGAGNTELCPLTTFDHQPVYQPGQEPDAAEVRRRLDAYWRPYHEQLDSELQALKDRFGVAVLFDAHSIRSQVPRFFDGQIQDFSLGTAEGASASPALVGRVMNVLTATGRFSSVQNGRFKGGFITRRYGNPAENIHSIQLELSQVTYMDEQAPFSFREESARQVRPTLERLLSLVVEWAWENAAGRRRSAYL